MKFIETYVDRQEERLAYVDEDYKSAGPLTFEAAHLGRAYAFSSMNELQRWASAQMDRPDVFFSYEVGPADLVLEDDTLVLCKSDSLRENVVIARVFDSWRSDAPTVVIVPHWNVAESDYNTIVRLLTAAGYHVAVMTLPFHGARATWPHHKISNAFLSANIPATILSIRDAVRELRSVIHWADQRSRYGVNLVGISLGSCIAGLATAFEPGLRSSSLLLTAGDFAETVWTGRATRHVRQAFGESLTLDSLRRLWAIISPASYLQQIAAGQVPHLLISGRRDRVVPFALSERHARDLAAVGTSVSFHALSCGHYTLSMFPYSLHAMGLLLLFLRKQRGAMRKTARAPLK